MRWGDSNTIPYASSMIKHVRIYVEVLLSRSESDFSVGTTKNRRFEAIVLY